MQEFISILSQKKSLSQKQAYDVLDLILQGNQKEDDIFMLLKLLTEKGESVDELIGFVKALKEKCLPIKHKLKSPLIDTCGTGGSGKSRFNISTCVSFVLAAGGVHVAKHGNYGSQRPNGSFNFLEDMNIDFDFSPEEILRLLGETNLCFLFARTFHPAMKYVAKARKTLGCQNIFNLMGPLANPLGVDYQIIGLSSEKKLDLLVETVKQLPMKKVAFCIGGDGKDEISLTGDTKIITVTKDSVEEELFNFRDEIDGDIEDYYCGDSQENAEIFSHILMDFEWDHSILKHISINAALGFKLAEKVNTLKEGYDLALNLFKTETVTEKINEYKLMTVDLRDLAQING
ncbi:anthranilate phosphoribosyltransferase [Candidatus Marinamargulisbacteria bacterium SCGC AG-343-D04]|nr:anthranilate phosphoribosyltransferase [Candidatus Marinamargulisbacteria bacterium SCGC AG-343-D04]